MKIELVETEAEKLARLLADGEIALTFSCNPDVYLSYGHEEAFSNQILAAIDRNFSVSLNLMVRALSASDIMEGKHRGQNCPSVSVRNIAGMEFIFLSEGNNLRKRCLSMFHEAGLEPKVKMEISQLVTACHLAENQNAATFTSDALERNLNSPLRFFLQDSEEVYRDFHLVLARRNYVPQAVCNFFSCFCGHEV